MLASNQSPEWTSASGPEDSARAIKRASKAVVGSRRYKQDRKESLEKLSIVRNIQTSSGIGGGDYSHDIVQEVVEGEETPMLRKNHNSSPEARPRT